MTLNLTQIKDLEYICQLAEDRLLPDYKWLSPDNRLWRERIRTYRTLFQNAIAKELPKPEEPVLDDDI